MLPTDNFGHFGRLAETTFVIPTSSDMFESWLKMRSRKDQGIGVIPSLKHYHHPHLVQGQVSDLPDTKEFGICWDIFDIDASKGSQWVRLPVAAVTIIPLSSRGETAQTEVWVARLSQRGSINGQPAEVAMWQLANREYDRLVEDIVARWPKTQLTAADHRVLEWEAWGGRLPGVPPKNASQMTAPTAGTGNSKSARLLFLAASPADQDRLRLDEEVRRIDQALRLANNRERLTLDQQWAVKASELQQLLLRHQPHIVHFSGHGSTANEIILESHDGTSIPVTARAIGNLFELLQATTKCVVLNACYSEQQAKAIADHIDCVVGMTKSIRDNAAIEFSASFYNALAYGQDVQTAFKFGCNQLELHNFPEEHIPVLLAPKTDPSTITLTP